MMKYFLSLTAVCLLLTGCSNKNEELSTGDHDHQEINITECKFSHFFEVNSNFQMSSVNKAKLEKLLRDSKGEGIENIGFMIVSDSPILKEQKAKISSQVKSQMIRAGFLESRIVDSGICVYKDAKKGVRVDILKYDLQRTEIDMWTDSVGDCDIEKDLPSYGKAINYNLEEMVANSADLISPRKYKGQRTQDAIKAVGDVASSSGGSSGGGSSRSSSSSSSSSSGH